MIQHFLFLKQQLRSYGWRSVLLVGLAMLATPVVGEVTPGRSAKYAGSASAASLAFDVTAGEPTVSGFSPSSGLPGTVVTITGTNLNEVTGVQFNGTATTGITLVNATTLQAFVPVGATTGPVKVTKLVGSGSSTATFAVTAIRPDATVSVTPAGPLSACSRPTLTAAATL
ncbi:MAG TPA: IPT/TIG domain-containing protein, partial [Hymenobacter sp.]